MCAMALMTKSRMTPPWLKSASGTFSFRYAVRNASASCNACSSMVMVAIQISSGTRRPRRYLHGEEGPSYVFQGHVYIVPVRSARSDARENRGSQALIVRGKLRQVEGANLLV